MMKKAILLTLFILLINSCSIFMEEETFVVHNFDSNNLSIMFSGNINGETHPCGCRHFPLGGLQNVAGLVHKVKKGADVLLIDAGDTFFPSNTMPKTLEKSLKFTAKNLAKGMSDLGVRYIVPGDQDFSAGVKFLNQLAIDNQFEFLLSNLRSEKALSHRKMVLISKGPHKIFMLGFVSPSTLRPQHKHLFNDVGQSMKTVMKDVEEAGYEKENPFHRLIVVSHSGIDDDRELAKKYPQINWLIGSHTQSFTKDPFTEGKTNLVQVLSRNHYIGEVKINFQETKDKDGFMLNEIREELVKELEPNPFLDFINAHKTDLEKIQMEEQMAMSVSSGPISSYPPPSSCIECHVQQGEKWKSTAHSLAYLTLVKEKASNNMDCLKCHTLGANNPRGFQRSVDVVQFEKGHVHNGEGFHNHGNLELKKEDLEKNSKNYWNSVLKSKAMQKSIRTMSSKKVLKEKNKWMKLDEKHHVKAQFSNVQCLNCHDKVEDHPFTSIKPLSKEESVAKIKQRCFECHNRDQDPDLYEMDKKTNSFVVKRDLFQKRYDMIKCPLGIEGQ